jgi:hypothetical protein
MILSGRQASDICCLCVSVSLQAATPAMDNGCPRTRTHNRRDARGPLSVIKHQDFMITCYTRSTSSHAAKPTLPGRFLLCPQLERPDPTASEVVASADCKWPCTPYGGL